MCASATVHRLIYREMAIQCGRQNATIMRQCAIMRPYTVAEEEKEEDYAFCKVCDDSFSVAHCGGNVVSHASRSSPVTDGHIAALNKLFNCDNEFVC